MATANLKVYTNGNNAPHILPLLAMFGNRPQPCPTGFVGGVDGNAFFGETLAEADELAEAQVNCVQYWITDLTQ